MLVIVIALMTAAGCGSSATTTTAPSPLVSCSLTLDTGNQTLPATGGNGSIGVSTTRECTWTVNVEGTWLSVRSGQRGQGDGTVEFAASANPDPVQRRGALVLNAQRAEITQAAALCDMSLAQSAGSFTPDGGSGRVDIRASSSLCTWTASSDASWIQIRSATEGRGSGTVLFDVASTTGPPRSGTLTVAGQRFSVTQSEGCTYSIGPTTYSASPSGGAGAIMVTTTAACPWTAASNVPWITVSPSTGSGPSAVTFNVDSTDGPARTGTAVIAGHVFTVMQSPGCTYEVQPTTHAIPASGGTATVTVNSATGCAWTAASNVSWISIQARGSGSGPGSVTFAVSTTDGPSRTGTLTIAGRQVTVTQSQGCAFEVGQTQESIPASGGNGTVTVTAGDGCAWTASSDVPWITIQSGATGSGNGTVNYFVAATNGPTRSGTLTVAGHKITINQGQGCTFAINPTQETVPAAGGGGKVAVTTANGCAWTASSNASWLSITSGANGTGPGAVQYSAASTTGAARSGTLTIAGQTFTVNQGQGCTFTLSPTNATVPDAGGQTSFNVQSGTGCNWTASTQASWITIASGASGSGNGTVQLTVASHTGPPRTGSVTVGGATFTVNQNSGCSYSLSTTSENIPAGGGNGSVGVSAAAGCPWTAASNASWLTIANPSSGTGNGSVNFSASANSGPARTATLTIAGHSFTVNQASGCTYSVSPTTLNVTAAAGQSRVDITAGANCTWNTSSGASWITISGNGSGVGNGAVDLSVAANTGPARNGAATIAGINVTVNQASGCTFQLSTTSVTVPSGGGNRSVDVTTDDRCPWTATSEVPWITITEGASETGNATVKFTVQARTSGSPRTGTLRIAGQTYTVNQQ